MAPQSSGKWWTVRLCYGDGGGTWAEERRLWAPDALTAVARATQASGRYNTGIVYATATEEEERAPEPRGTAFNNPRVRLEGGGPLPL